MMKCTISQEQNTSPKPITEYNPSDVYTQSSIAQIKQFIVINHSIQGAVSGNPVQ